MLTNTTRSGYSRSAALQTRAPAAMPLLAIVAALAALITLTAALILSYGWRHDQTMYRGVSAAGMNLSGLTLSQATERIRTQIQSRAPQTVEFTSGGTKLSVPAQQLGIKYDAEVTARQAYDYGRTGNLWNDTRAWLTGLVSHHQVPLAVSIDAASVNATLRRMAPSVTKPARNAEYVFGADGQLAIQPSVNGVGINVAKTTASVLERAESLSSHPVEVATVSVPPTVDARSLQSQLERARSMVSQPLILSVQGERWKIEPGTLRSMLTVSVTGDHVEPTLVLDRAALSASVSSLRQQVARSGQDAQVVWDGNRFAVESSAAGRTLDVDATVNAIERSLTADEHTVAMVTTSAPATIDDAAAQDAIQRAQALLAQPLKLFWSGGSLDLAAGELAPLLHFAPKADAPSTFGISIDQAALNSLLTKTVAPKVEVPAKNADLRYLDGAVKVVSTEKTGIALDVDKSAAAVQSALLGQTRAAALVTKPVEPQITAAMASTIVIRDQLATAATSYAGSVANRKWNVELAVSRVNGALVPPGGTFSFDGTVGAIDTNNGYKVGYGIVGTSNGSVSTVPSVGGGVCQVSTTVFQTAFWAGMPIVDRSWHLYWIPLYGEPPSGRTGLDATVDTDAGLDMKFKNTTNNWLAIVGTADGTTVRFELWGTQPNWQVKVDDPVVTNVVKADTAMQYETSNQLAPGTSVLVEHAEDGFDVDVHRQVIQNSKVIDDLHLKSHYVPSANVTLQGE